jgi:hypothetical protein
MERHTCVPRAGGPAARAPRPRKPANPSPTQSARLGACGARKFILRTPPPRTAASTARTRSVRTPAHHSLARTAHRAGHSPLPGLLQNLPQRRPPRSAPLSRGLRPKRAWGGRCGGGRTREGGGRGVSRQRRHRGRGRGRGRRGDGGAPGPPHLPHAGGPRGRGRTPPVEARMARRSGSPVAPSAPLQTPLTRACLGRGAGRVVGSGRVYPAPTAPTPSTATARPCGRVTGS